MKLPILWKSIQEIQFKTLVLLLAPTL